MLRKMLFQGLFAAAVIAGSAALYAVATAAELPQAMPAQVAAGPGAGNGPVPQGGAGYLQPDRGRPAEAMRDRRENRERHEMRDRERREYRGDHAGRRGHDDD